MSRKRAGGGGGGGGRGIVTCSDFSEGDCFSCSASKCHARHVKQLPKGKVHVHSFDIISYYCTLMYFIIIMTNLLCCVELLIDGKY